MIVITGAGGKTGRALLKALAKEGAVVRGLVRRAEQAAELLSAGANSAQVGDLRNASFLREAFHGAQAVYHICPNMSPDELSIGENALSAAREAGVEHFVYHSVLHSQVEAMPHHWLKMRVEERIFTSGLPFTILQPGAYMQNVLAYRDSICNQGVYPVPYSVDARLSMVDLEDVAEAASRVLLDGAKHTGSVYELSGPQPLSQVEVAQILSLGSGRPVEARAVDRFEWERRARASGIDNYAVETLLKMFLYYENYGLVGNSTVLEYLLGRPPHRFAEFVNRHL